MATPIVSIICPGHHVLTQPTTAIGPDELSYAEQIADKLRASLLALQGPKAGLAAPQIGISRSIFIYSWNREPENLEVVINPEITKCDETMVRGWEGCLSAMPVRKLANVFRHQEIEASYTTLQGKKVQVRLTGFAAKAFQHEYDHLKGIVNVNRQDADVQSFETAEELSAFMVEVRKKDALVYIKPEFI